ncbi:protein shisa-5 [Sinocyclocheilus rhinocerous]|uniref:protein shisa-5 n=1 Tax=Sinocyclocheilus rhinocerous TaxID=307959 RepID=UPI0007B807C6|nr:PREDICTED: protein shisa-5-like [Sinocyclocheilus rhinocerous]
MASNFTVFLLSTGLFTTVVGFERCSMYKTDSVVCDFWRSEFCCGTCDESYCCSDQQKKFTIKAQSDCLFKDLRISPKYSPQRDAVSIAVSASILGLVVVIILFLICWVCPRCYLYKRFRNPRPVITTTTVVTTQYLPQPSAVIQGGQYLPYQALPNNPPCGDQPMSTGPPPSYQEAVGPGYPVPIHDGGQATYPLQSSLPTDYTSPQPAYNPAYTSCNSSAIKTSN